MTEGKQVWVVMYYDYNQTGAVGVYSEEQAARDAAAALNDEHAAAERKLGMPPSTPPPHDVEMFILDAPQKEVKWE